MSRADDEERSGTSRFRTIARHEALAIAAGVFAGVPQVFAAQLVGTLVGQRERADIAPRFVQSTAQHAGTSLSRPARWLLATLFHFSYAAGWGAVYGGALEALGPRRVPPLLASGVLGALIYTAAFSRIGAGTQTGAESHPDERSGREWTVHLVSALSYALTLAYSYRWLRRRG